MIILNNLFPVFALIGLGALLKHIHLTGESFLKASDRLVYFIFFPAMLFWKIGGASGGQGISIGLCLSGMLGVTIVFCLSLLQNALLAQPPRYAKKFYPRNIKYMPAVKFFHMP